MSNETETRLSAFSKDIQRIAEDVENLADDLGHDSRTLRDEVVGAEILATKEITETIGILWEVAERLNAIRAEQARLLFDDYAATFDEFTNAFTDAPSNPPGLRSYSNMAANHWQRRVEHMADGARSVANLVTKETNLLEDVIFGMWKPFFAVVHRDWDSKA